jgi:hypothetical protein
MSLDVAAEEAAGKLKRPSFRGMFLPRNPSFSCVSVEEGFLASLGMTENAIFSATSDVTAHKDYL